MSFPVTSGPTLLGPVILKPPRFRASVDLIKPFLGFLHIRKLISLYEDF